MQAGQTHQRQHCCHLKHAERMVYCIYLGGSLPSRRQEKGFAVLFDTHRERRINFCTSSNNASTFICKQLIYWLFVNLATLWKRHLIGP